MYLFATGPEVELSYSNRPNLENPELGDKAPLESASSNGNAAIQDQALAKAVSLHLDGNREQALQELDLLLEKGGANAEVWAARGHVQFELGQYDEAAESYAKLLELVPEHNTGRLHMALCLQNQGQWSEAAVRYQELVDNGGDSCDARLGLGNCLLHLSKPAEALEHYDKCAQEIPDDERVIFGKAVALHVNEQPDEARPLYEKVLELNPDSDTALRNMVTSGDSNR